MDQLEMPAIKIPAAVFLDHEKWSMPDYGIESAIFVVENAIKHDVPVTSYEDMCMILKYLKRYKNLIDIFGEQ